MPVIQPNRTISYILFIYKISSSISKYSKSSTKLNGWVFCFFISYSLRMKCELMCSELNPYIDAVAVTFVVKYAFIVTAIVLLVYFIVAVLFPCNTKFILDLALFGLLLIHKNILSLIPLDLVERKVVIVGAIIRIIFC